MNLGNEFRKVNLGKQVFLVPCGSILFILIDIFQIKIMNKHLIC